MSKKNGKGNGPLLHVTIDGEARTMTLEEFKSRGRPCTAHDLKLLRQLGKDLFRSDQEFEDFQKWLKRSRAGD